jgi:CRP-like cAMP-binding protein
MRRRRRSAIRVLGDGTPLRNHLLAALPQIDYQRIRRQLRMNTVALGETLQEPGARITKVYFPNGGVFSITTEMRDGAVVEIATIGREGMLGLGVFFGDRRPPGRTFQQVPDGLVPSMGVVAFLNEAVTPGRFREVISLYAQFSLLQAMQGAACNALHDVTQRCCRWLLETRDRLDTNDFPLKQEFLAVMLGVRRPTVAVVMRSLDRAGLISSGYGRIRILQQRRLEAASCECYSALRSHLARLGL